MNKPLITPFLIFIAFSLILVTGCSSNDDISGEARKTAAISPNSDQQFDEKVKKTHLKCVGSQCKLIIGHGKNQCVSDADCNGTNTTTTTTITSPTMTSTGPITT